MLAAVRLLLLFVHVMAFAVALGCVLREDAKLLTWRPLDAESLQSAARVVRFALIALWASGAALIMIDTGAMPLQIAESPKLLAKLTVVGVLTVNGMALHRIAFPVLLGRARRTRNGAALASALGAISAASWLSATLLGIARSHARGLDYVDFMLAYTGALAIALAFALLFVRPRILHKMRNRVQPADEPIAAGRASDLPLARDN